MKFTGNISALNHNWSTPKHLSWRGTHFRHVLLIVNVITVHEEHNNYLRIWVLKKQDKQNNCSTSSPCKITRLFCLQVLVHKKNLIEQLRYSVLNPLSPNNNRHRLFVFIKKIYGINNRSWQSRCTMYINWWWCCDISFYHLIDKIIAFIYFLLICIDLLNVQFLKKSIPTPRKVIENY